MEVGIGYCYAINEQAGSLCIGVQGHALLGRIAELHRFEVLQVSCEPVGASFQLALDGVGSPFRLVAVIDALLFHEVGHRLHLGQQFVDDGIGFGRLEHASSHDAEGVDELASIALVIQQVEQQVDDIFVEIAFSVHRAGRLEVEEIGEGAFYHCLGLKSIKLGSGLKSIGDMAFEACVELGYFPSNPKPLVIPGNVESIGSEAFSSCDIMLLTLENGVKTIGEQAFFSCSFLRTVEIPSSVESIGKEAFYCEGFESIADLAETPQPYAEEMLGSVDKTFPIRVPDASVAAYKQAWPVYANRIVGLVNIQFESELVKRIAVTNWDTSGDGELSYAEAAAVTDLGEVFKGIHDSFTFDELKYFTGLESIGENAFSESYGLEHIELPSSIKSIGKSAFNFCYSLTHIELPSSIESIGWGAFANCVDIKQISIPEGVTEIGDFAFAGLSLDSFHLPASVNVFDGSSIAYCNLSEVTVAAGNTTFYSPSGSNAIMYRSAPTLVVGCSTIPEGTLVIGPYAFSGRNITSIKIPATVFVIGEGAFYACEKLESVYDFATTPQTPLNQMLDVYSKTFPIYVPIGSVDAYKTAWPNYADRIKPMDLDASFEKFNDEKEW